MIEKFYLKTQRPTPFLLQFRIMYSTSRLTSNSTRFIAPNMYWELLELYSTIENESVGTVRYCTIAAYSTIQSYMCPLEMEHSAYWNMMSSTKRST